MKNTRLTHKMTGFTAGLLMLSVIFMILIIPSVYSDSIPNEKNTGALIGITLAAVIRITLFILTIRLYGIIKRNKYLRKNGDYFMVIGILSILFGLLYSDGAFAFYNEEPLYIAPFMFASVFCDLFAGILLIIVAFIY